MKKIIIIFIILLIISSCGGEKVHTSVFLAMGNIPVEIKVYDNNQLNYDSIFEEIKDTVKMLDSLFNKFSDKSPIYKFNKFNHTIKYNPYIHYAIIKSESIRTITNGLFDIRIETILQYYERCEREQRNIIDDSLRFFAQLLEDGNIKFDKENNVYKTHNYIEIDFGGDAKGYFGEIIKRILLRHNIKKAIINLGGDLVVFNKKDNKPFRVGIRNAKGDSIYKTVQISNGSIVTSGDYFRYYKINGKKYCHIVNPKTGKPADSVHSVTVITENGIIADALATALMLMNKKYIEKFAKEHNITVYIQ